MRATRAGNRGSPAPGRGGPATAASPGRPVLRHTMRNADLRRQPKRTKSSIAYATKSDHRWSVRSADVEPAGPGPLELEEMRIAGQREYPLEDGQGLLPARDRVQHRSEDRDPVHVQDGNSDLAGGRVHALAMTLAHLLVVGI